LKAQDVLALMQKNSVEMLDLRITDLLGRWHHFTLPAAEVDAEVFRQGVPFDGSSFIGFRSIDQSDMVILPDPETAVMDPFAPVPTLAIIGDVAEPTLRPFTRDPRSVAARAEAYLKASGIADLSYWGPELEFFLFDGVRYGTSQHESFYELESAEGSWSSREGRRQGYEVRPKGGYAPLPPTDSTYPVRTEIVQWLLRQGIRVEMHHHEVATAGQQEIDLRYQTLKRQADTVMLYKYTVKNTAARHGKTATFMPKPLYGDNGSGMHVHQSLWRAGEPLPAPRLPRPWGDRLQAGRWPIRPPARRGPPREADEGEARERSRRRRCGGGGVARHPHYGPLWKRLKSPAAEKRRNSTSSAEVGARSESWAAQLCSAVQ
jgi:glutamine synthetase